VELQDNHRSRALLFSMIKEELTLIVARLRAYIYRHNINMIMSGAVRPKVNHNCLSRQFN
jgi:hypothetical protein